MNDGEKNHAFVIFCFQKNTLSFTTAHLLSKYWPASVIYFYSTDLLSPDEIALFSTSAKILEITPEKNLTQAMVNCLNTCLNFLPQQPQLKSFTILFPGMIPLFPDTFYDYMKNFAESRKPFVFCPHTAKSMLADIGSLHFNLKSDLLHQIKFERYERDTIFDYPEYALTTSLDQSLDRSWKQNVLLSSKINFGTFLSQGIFANNINFAYKSYYPETSLLYTPDPTFFKNYEKLSIFEKDISLNNLPLS